MSHYLITSGPTREYLDPVRFLTNASSGRMGQALAEAAVEQGHFVTVVSGPVRLAYPPGARIVEVMTTEEMLQAAAEVFPQADVFIAAAAPCDYRPARPAEQKRAKSGQPLWIEFWETPDILATLAGKRSCQTIVGFALETHEHRSHALTKLHRKTCDLIVVNDCTAMEATTSAIEVLDPQGQVILHAEGLKRQLAADLIRLVDRRMMEDGSTE